MLVEPFAHGRSMLHRLDPRCKLLVAVAFALTVALADRGAVIAAALAGALVLACWARLSPGELVRRLRLANVFLLAFWVLVVPTYGGPAVASLGPFSLSAAGVTLALQVTGKVNAILLALFALLATTPIVTTGQAMLRLGVPAKLVHLLLFTYRYIHVIEQEYQRLYHAALMRGFRPGVSRRAFSTYACLVGMLLVRSLGRSVRVHEAMLCRGFQGKLYSLRRFSLTTSDLLVFGLLSMAVAALAGSQWLSILR